LKLKNAIKDPLIIIANKDIIFGSKKTKPVKKKIGHSSNEIKNALTLTP